MGPCGFLAVRVPQADQSYGIHLTLNLRGTFATQNDNALVYRFSYMLRTGREFFHR
jgi:hypothetical protein